MAYEYREYNVHIIRHTTATLYIYDSDMICNMIQRRHWPSALCSAATTTTSTQLWLFLSLLSTFFCLSCQWDVFIHAECYCAVIFFSFAFLLFIDSSIHAIYTLFSLSCVHMALTADHVNACFASLSPTMQFFTRDSVRISRT